MRLGIGFPLVLLSLFQSRLPEVFPDQVQSGQGGFVLLQCLLGGNEECVDFFDFFFGVYIAPQFQSAWLDEHWPQVAIDLFAGDAQPFFLEDLKDLAHLWCGVLEHQLEMLVEHGRRVQAVIPGQFAKDIESQIIRQPNIRL